MYVAFASTVERVKEGALVKLENDLSRLVDTVVDRLEIMNFGDVHQRG